MGDFGGMSLTEINAFVCANAERMVNMGLIVDLWLVLDEAGLAAAPPTGIVCSKAIADADDEEEAAFAYTDEFEGLRVPLDQVWTVFATLSHTMAKEWVDYHGTEPVVNADGTKEFSMGSYEEIADPDVLERKRVAWESWSEQGFIE